MSDTPALPAPASKDAPLTNENLDSVIRWALREPYLILSAISARLDQIESAANKSLWDRL